MTQHFIEKPVWTYADYCVLPQDFNRHEIIEGDHVVTPSPTTRHQHVLANLTSLLNLHVRAHGLGVVLAAPMDVLLAPTSVVQPDLLFISKERLGIMKEANIQGAPDLVVEVLSPSNKRDKREREALEDKIRVCAYARILLWIVDPEMHSVKVYVPGQPVRTLEYDEVLNGGDVLPGFELPVKDIFPD